MWSRIDIHTDIDTGVSSRCTVNIENSTRIEMKSDNDSICMGNIDISNIKMHLDVDIVITTTASLKLGNMCPLNFSIASHVAVTHDCAQVAQCRGC